MQFDAYVDNLLNKRQDFLKTVIHPKARISVIANLKTVTARWPELWGGKNCTTDSVQISLEIKIRIHPNDEGENVNR